MKTFSLIRLSLILMALIGSVYSQAAMLEGGPNFNVASLSGNITITCSPPQMPTDTAFFGCAKQVIEPQNLSRLIATPIANESTAILHSTHPDGSNQTRTVAIDPATGKSAVLEVWNSNQDAFLQVGTNDISFEILDGSGQNIGHGSFKVTLSAENRTCYPRAYQSFRAQDCMEPWNMCPRYFDWENNCKYEP